MPDKTREKLLEQYSEVLQRFGTSPDVIAKLLKGAGDAHGYGLMPSEYIQAIISRFEELMKDGEFHPTPYPYE